MKRVYAATARFKSSPEMEKYLNRWRVVYNSLYPYLRRKASSFRERMESASQQIQ